MKNINAYCSEVLQRLKDKYPWEKEFIQAVHEVFLSVGMVVENDSHYRHERILERIVEPERTLIFRVPWKLPSLKTGDTIFFDSPDKQSG